MKQVKTILIFLIFIPLTLTGQKSKIKETSVQSTFGVTLLNASDSSQYILGAYIGQYLKANNLTIVNPALFNRGLDDVLSGKPLLVHADSIPKMVNDYLSKAMTERNKMLEQQLFNAVKSQPGVGVMPNGVCYVIAKAGNGPRPMSSDTLTIHVKGYLPDGTIFEDTYSRNTPLKTTPATLIAGLKEAIQIMPEGSVWRIYVPSALAYGEKGVQGIIPPFSALIFDVELLSVKK
ncbi:MAG TPA: FKBP-type peptidyl-prolyl cis-trans isomerase [Bacteroidales bacterium]|nr:FKBP-type peptidyl-prolyl cis-trans isomerase [Bacteroidales bacterium]